MMYLSGLELPSPPRAHVWLCFCVVRESEKC